MISICFSGCSLWWYFRNQKTVEYTFVYIWYAKSNVYGDVTDGLKACAHGILMVPRSSFVEPLALYQYLPCSGSGENAMNELSVSIIVSDVSEDCESCVT